MLMNSYLFKIKSMILVGDSKVVSSLVTGVKIRKFEYKKKIVNEFKFL